mgnify:CR=1 FL=1
MRVFSQWALPRMSGSRDREEQDGSAEAGVVLATLADAGPRDRKERVGLDGALSAIVG